MVFYWDLSDSKSPQISRTLLGILTDLNNAVGWTVSARTPISNSFSLFTKPLGIIPSTLITTGITIPFMFHCFFSSLKKSKYLSLFSFSLIFTQWFTRIVKFPNWQVLLLSLLSLLLSLFVSCSYQH